LKIFKDPVVPRAQVMLLPRSVEEFVSVDDPVRALDEIIDDMDLGDLIGSYSGGGAPAYDPIMMLKVIVFGYSQGIRSSRKLDASLGRDVRFMFLAEMSRPDFRTIARFRRDNLDAVKRAFKETVRIALGAGLVLLEHVSVDGTKIEANVSSKHTYKRERLEKALLDVEERIESILRESEDVDAEEDKRYGDRRGDEMPKALVDARHRKEMLKAAKKHLEASGRETVCATDVESRVMKTRSGNRAAYNAQAVVDKERQVIVAAGVTQDEFDNHQMPVMMRELVSIVGRKPECVTLDGGYFSEETLKHAEEESLNIYVPDNQAERGKKGFEYDEGEDEYVCPSGQRLSFYAVRKKKERIYHVYRHSCSGCKMRESCCGEKSRVKEIWRRMNGELQDKMSAKMQTDEAKEIYRLRKQIIEPVHGNVKDNKGLRRFLLRGKLGAEIEYMLGCAAHNIDKIIRFGPRWAGGPA
jgi:transposase